jgi:hypothetical protein
MLFWFVMTLLYCVIISSRPVTSLAIPPRLVLLPSRSGETLAVGNGGNPFCVDRGAIVRVFSDCWASSTFALGFLVRPFGGAAGGTRGGVADTRLGVEAAIGALRSVGRRGRLAAGGLQQGCGRSGSAALPARGGDIQCQSRFDYRENWSGFSNCCPFPL